MIRIEDIKGRREEGDKREANDEDDEKGKNDNRNSS